MSDEEKKAIEHIKNYPINWLIENVNKSAIKIVLNLIEKQSKKIEELKDKFSDEKIRNTVIKRYREVIEKDYISKEESEQRERKAYIKGTNDAYELCNKMWKDKIKAKVKEISKEWAEGELDGEWYEFMKYHLESLLEKE